MAPTTKRPRRAGAREPRDPAGTREALLGSALALFARNGFDATPVQRIVDDAGLTKGAFYHHFESKDDLLLEIHDAFIDQQLVRARAILDADLDPEEALRRFLREVLLEPVARFKTEIEVFFQERRFLSEEAFAEVKAKRDEFDACAMRLVQRGIDSGVWRDVGPPRLVGFGLIGMCAWAYHWFDPDGPVSVGELAAIYSDMVLAGLRDGSAA